MNMIQPFATALVILLVLLATTLMVGHAIDAAQDDAQSSDRVDTGHGRRAIQIQYNYKPCPQVPTLHCRNGSNCRPGTASFGKIHAHLDLQTHESGYYCDCPQGFVGHECEVEVEDCKPDDPSDPVHSCYHGSECTSDSGSGYACDCSKTDGGSGATGPKYAGAMCQHESTSMCAVSLSGEYAPDRQFCTNHGECVKMVSGGEPHPGCICSPGWTGDHCELRRDPFSSPQLEEGGEDGGEGPNVTLWSLVIIPVVVGAIVAYKVSGVIKAQWARAAAQTMVFKGHNATTLSTGDLDADGSGTMVSQGHNATTLSTGDLDADGSGTLGSDVADSERDEPLGSPEEDGDVDGVEGYIPETKIV